jgi:hypothetical protein
MIRASFFDDGGGDKSQIMRSCAMFSESGLNSDANREVAQP